LILKVAIKIPKPTADSATAIDIIYNAKTWPSGEAHNNENTIDIKPKLNSKSSINNIKTIMFCCLLKTKPKKLNKKRIIEYVIKLFKSITPIIISHSEISYFIQTLFSNVSELFIILIKLKVLSILSLNILFIKI
jgi:hypothetical protein